MFDAKIAANEPSLLIDKAVNVSPICHRWKSPGSIRY
jgi:hypothetical protein